MTTNVDDKALAKRLAAGDEAAFTRFFDDNFARLYRFALPRLRNDDEATKEVLQVTMSKAVRNIGRYRGEAALFTWLCSICRNEISEWLRKQGRYEQRVVLIEDHPEIQAALDSFHAPAALTPERQFERQEMVRMIQLALDRLPKKYGDALEWKYVEGYSVMEIAERLNIGQEAAQSLLARAKRAFADVYGSLLTALSQSAATSRTERQTP